MPTTEPKYPDIEVQLSGEDGNVFAIIGRCVRAMQRAGIPDAEQKAFVTEMKSGDYDHALQIAMQWFDCT